VNIEQLQMIIELLGNTTEMTAWLVGGYLGVSFLFKFAVLFSVIYAILRVAKMIVDGSTDTGRLEALRDILFPNGYSFVSASEYKKIVKVLMKSVEDDS